MFTCRDGKGGKLSSQASKMLYKPPRWSGLYFTIRSCFSVHYRVMEHAGSLESTKEA